MNVLRAVSQSNGGSSGITIGTLVIGGSPNEVLYIDNNGKLAGNVNFEYINGALQFGPTDTFSGSKMFLTFGGVPFIQFPTYDSVFIGRNAGGTSATGSSNLAIGNYCMYQITTGAGNCAIGPDAGANIQTGNGNFALGASALQGCVSNSNSIAIGTDSLRAATADDNISIGTESGRNTTTGGENCFVGLRSGYSNDTGTFNSFYGRYSGYYTDAGSYNSALGYFAGVNNTGGAINYSTAIGYLAEVTMSNQIMLGTIAETVYIPGSASIAALTGNLGFFGTTPIAKQNSSGVTTVAGLIILLQNYGLIT